ncbi:MAG: hypothetical protein CMK65_00885 [Pseudoalteromonas sp.]|uniref:hypothetical protein n=1 Tax=Pseudoalteromonas sp. TaxID=53249 RepID=UPI000C991EF0|nr:hypothetical protein [Pseudoalteromonas sp.]MAD02168.1 hypothetical protein [Pseudoalteromonas sp.]|tara:strand:+ start:15894 stop:17015 length:1122 start_codon:yes stop_codon:yes gene_type:complete
MLVNFLKTQVANKLLSYLGIAPYQIEVSNGAFFVSDISLVKPSPIVILSRDCYDIEHQTYPVENEKQLRKIINLEHEIDGCRLSFVIGDFMQGARVVTFFKVKAKYADILAKSKPLMVIPDAMLFIERYEAEYIKYNLNNKSYWFFSNNNIIYSIPENPLVKNINLFAASIGQTIGEQQVKELELKRLQFDFSFFYSLLSKNRFSQFFVSNKKHLKLNHKAIASFAVSFVCVFVLFQFSLASYYQYKTSNLKAENSALQSQVEGLFTARKSLLEKRSSIQSLADELSVQNVDMKVWRLLDSMLKIDGLSLMRVSSYKKDGKIIFSVMGNAERSSMVLQLLASDPWVDNVKFSSDVVNVSGKERFSITGELVDG